MHHLPDPERAKPCILVVDDDETIAWAIAGRLGPDFRVVGETDPARAVERARDEQADVILCDIDMPGMSGDDVAFAISQDPATAGIPFLYLTGLVSPDEVPEFEGVFGEHRTLSKESPTELLREAVGDALGLPRD
ncbi:response regulator [Ramlibacter pallidus]|uniref:Response regulator n=1 Tax=Ramlibacter pallidus TaxID=2780087 RepID=A0ABR9S969_9BURK|nr:response regulator [Ramlibacter pallidus]MBE7370086.1 response regulator [Ramlibacter pallidus]